MSTAVPGTEAKTVLDDPGVQAQLHLSDLPGLSTQDVRTLLGLVTEDEFGRAVGVVGATVAIWRNKGEGPPFYRFRRNIFYRTADIVQWVIENTWDPRTGQRLMPQLEPLQSVREPQERLSQYFPPKQHERAHPDVLRPQSPTSSPPPEGQRGAIGDHVPSVG